MKAFKNDHVLQTLLFALLISLIFGLRFWHLEADPPVDLSASGGYFADEGYWTHNARNKVLFGVRTLDEWNDMFISPLLHLATSVSFSLFGVTLYSARLVPVVASILIILLVYAALVREGNRIGAYFALLFLGCHYPFLVYNRVAILETPATFLLVLAFYLFSRKGGWSLFLSGFAIGAAYLTKTTLIFIIPASYLALLGHDLFNRREHVQGRRVILTDMIYFSAGLVIPVIFWVFYILLPHGEMLAGYNEYYRVMLLPASLSGCIKTLLSQRFYIFFNRTPVLLLVSHFYAIIVFFDILDRRRHFSRMELFSWFWYGIGIIFLALFTYRPLRYFVPLIPAMVVLSALFLESLMVRGRQGLMSINSRSRFFFVIVWMLIPVGQNLGLLVDRYLFNYSMLRPFLGVWPVVGIWYPGMIIVALLGLGMIGYLIYVRSSKQSTSSDAPRDTKLAVVLLTVIFCLVNGVMSVNWLAHPNYTVLNINHELARFPARGAFTGQWAGELCLETPHWVVPVYKGFVNDQTPFSRFPIRYFLLWNEYNHTDDFFSDFPEIVDKVELVKEFRVKQSDVFFFALSDRAN